MRRVPEPGEVYWADVGASGRRPAIVVSRTELNRGTYVVAVLVTSSRLEQRRSAPSCVFLSGGSFGLAKDCVAQAETIAMIERAVLDVDSGPIGALDVSTLRDLVRAIGHVISAECEPA